VYFDGAPAGHARIRKLGAVTAHFIRLGQSADSAMRARLKSMGRSAKNWTVVSSDHEVRSAARMAQADSLTADEFARSLKKARASAPKANEDKILSKREVDDWLELFGMDENHTEDQ